MVPLLSHFWAKAHGIPTPSNHPPTRRNVPNQLNRKQFVERLDQLGFLGMLFGCRKFLTAPHFFIIFLDLRGVPGGTHTPTYRWQFWCGKVIKRDDQHRLAMILTMINHIFWVFSWGFPQNFRQNSVSWDMCLLHHLDPLVCGLSQVWLCLRSETRLERAVKETRACQWMKWTGLYMYCIYIYNIIIYYICIPKLWPSNNRACWLIKGSRQKVVPYTSATHIFGPKDRSSHANERWLRVCELRVLQARDWHIGTDLPK